MFADEQVRHRSLQLKLDYPTAGKVPSVANPIRLSATPIEYDRAPPLLGQHTDEVHGRVLDLDPETLAELRDDAIIAQHPGIRV